MTLLALSTPGFAQLRPPRATVIENVRIHTMAADSDNAAAPGVIERGTIVIRGSRIIAIGADVDVPRRATRIDGSGLVATPGLIDVASALGMTSVGGGSVTVHALDAFDPYDTINLTDALRQGVTTIHVGPRSAGIAGLSSIIRLDRAGSGSPRRGADSADVGSPIGSAFREQRALFINLDSAARPLDRLNRVNQVRSAFRSARLHQEALETYEEELEEYIKKLEARRHESGDQSKPSNGKTPPNADEQTPSPAPDAGSDRRRGPRPAPRPGPRTSDEADSMRDDRARDAANENDEAAAMMQDPRRRRPQRQRGGSAGGANGNGGDDEELSKPDRPARNPAFETLIRALEHELPVHIEAHRSADILNALDIAEEFNIRIVLEGASEAHLVADAIARADVPVVLSAPMQSANTRDVLHSQQRHDALGIDDDVTAALNERGVSWVLGTGGRSESASRFLLMQAQLLAQRSRVSGDDGSGSIDPLALVTARAADFLGIGDEVGRLEVGKQADIVLWTGDPLDPASQVQHVFVAGRSVLTASAPGAAGAAPAGDEREGGGQ